MLTRVNSDRFYGCGDLAAIVDVDARTVRNWIESGDLNAQRFTRRGPWKIKGKEIIRFIDASFQSIDSEMNV